MASRLSMSQLAQAVKRGDQPAWMPRGNPSALHLGNITDTNLFHGTASFQFNDPSGLTVDGMPFMQSYSAANPPAAGHVAWVQQFGSNFVLLGQHVLPTNFITL